MSDNGLMARVHRLEMEGQAALDVIAALSRSMTAAEERIKMLEAALAAQRIVRKVSNIEH